MDHHLVEKQRQRLREIIESSISLEDLVERLEYGLDAIRRLLANLHDRNDEDTEIQQITDRFPRVTGYLGKTQSPADLKQAFYRLLFDTAGDAIFLEDEGEHIFAANPGAVELLGYPLEALLTMKTSDLEYEPLKNRPRLEIYTDPGSGDQTPFETVLRRKDGTPVPVEISVSTLQMNDENLFMSIVRDITERKRAERALRESENRYRTIFETTGTAAIIIEEDTTIGLANREFERLSGYSKEETEGRMSWTEFVKLSDLERMKEHHSKRRVDPDGVPTSYEFCFVDRNGRERDILLSVDMIPGTTRSVASLLDITERKQAERILRGMALLDELTGVYNRRGFMTIAREHLDHARRYRRPFLIAMADLDGLKQINDTHGHKDGDLALRDTVSVLKKTFRQSDSIGRIGGDEFAVCIPESGEDAIPGLLSRLNQLIDLHNRTARRRFDLSVSMGLVCYEPEEDVALDTLMAMADEFMYARKRQKRGTRSDSS